VHDSIEELKKEEGKNTEWFNRIGAMLAPLISEDNINRGNINKVLAMVEEQYLNE
jgi:hypothetical protein